MWNPGATEAIALQARELLPFDDHVRGNSGMV
jgi:hypothetical protein